MTEDRKDRLKKIRRFLFKKLPIILVVLFLMIIATLKMVERYPGPLREGFEEYLSSSYNSNATIGRLEKVKFFPTVDIHAENITMHQQSNAAIIQMEIQSFKVKAPFWSLFFNTGHIYDLDIQNLKANEGFILPKNFSIKKLSTLKREGPDQYGAFLIAGGTYNNQPAMLEAELESTNKGYKISSTIPYSLTLSNASLNGEIEKQHDVTRTLNTVLSIQAQSSEAKDYAVFKDNKFLTDNPLYCLLNADNLKGCGIYIDQ